MVSLSRVCDHGKLNVSFDQLAAYPLLHPVFLAEYVMEDRHITVLAHGHHDVSVSFLLCRMPYPYRLLSSTFLYGVIPLTRTSG